MRAIARRQTEAHFYRRKLHFECDRWHLDDLPTAERQDALCNTEHAFGIGARANQASGRRLFKGSTDHGGWKRRSGIAAGR